MAVSSLVSRKTLALALAAGGAMTALLSGQTANAQNDPCAPGPYTSGADTIRYYGNGECVNRNPGSQSNNRTSGGQNAAAAKPIVVDTAENRRFANQIYATAFAGIDKVLKAQGKEAALEYSQHPEQNLELMALVKKAHEGQYFLVTTVLTDAMFNAPAYINGDRKTSIPLSDPNWAKSASDVQEILNPKSPNLPELSYLKSGYEAPGYFGPRSKEAAGIVLRLNGAFQVQTASLERRP